MNHQIGNGPHSAVDEVPGRVQAEPMDDVAARAQWADQVVSVARRVASTYEYQRCVDDKMRVGAPLGHVLGELLLVFLHEVRVAGTARR